MIDALRFPAAGHTFCLSCGSPIEPWFDPEDHLYDVDKDDEEYERWLDTPCPECGKTPRDGGAK